VLAGAGVLSVDPFAPQAVARQRFRQRRMWAASVGAE